jgi:hypothetical protein
MRIQQSVFHCITCKHEWLAETVFDAPVSVFTASLLALSCPKCGAAAKNIAFGRGDVPDPTPVRNGMTDLERRAAWLQMHDNGLSSECIADRMCDLPLTGAYPHDGDDFGRCERLLVLYPDWRRRLNEMRAINPIWDVLVEYWDEIALAWRHDVDLSRHARAPGGDWRCYDVIRSVINLAGKPV